MTPEQRAAAIVQQVDALARDRDRFEIGLPPGHEQGLAEIRAEVERHIREAVMAERERCMDACRNLSASLCARCRDSAIEPAEALRLLTKAGAVCDAMVAIWPVPT